MDVEGCGRLSEHDGLWNVEGFSVCRCVGSLAGKMHICFVAVVGASAYQLRDRRVCEEVDCFVSPACIT